MKRASAFATFLIVSNAAIAAAQAENPRCVQHSELPVWPIPQFGTRSKAPTSRLALDFGKSAVCLDDGEKPRQAVLVALGTQPPLEVKISSIPDRKRLLPPLVSVLDASMHPLKQYRFKEFVQRNTQHTLSFHLGAASSGAYLLIEPDAEWIGANSSLVSGARFATVWVTPTLIGNYSNGSEQRIEMPFVEAGKLEIEIGRPEESLPGR
jgi:hypothetical protein